MEFATWIVLEPGVAVIAKAGAADADRLSRTTFISSTGNAKVSMLPITALFNVNITLLISPSSFSPLNVSEPQARAMVAAEAAIRRARTTTVIRPAGVYGDPQGMLIRRVLSGQGGAPGSSFGNRIHREDLARLITYCLQLDEQGEAVPPTLVAADEDTTPTYEVERWLAKQLGVRLSDAPQQAISRANRQCRSALLKEIGFTLIYPSWREGYTAAINAQKKIISA